MSGLLKRCIKYCFHSWSCSTLVCDCLYCWLLDFYSCALLYLFWTFLQCSLFFVDFSVFDGLQTMRIEATCFERRHRIIFILFKCRSDQMLPYVFLFLYILKPYFDNGSLRNTSSWCEIHVDKGKILLKHGSNWLSVFCTKGLVLYLYCSLIQTL